MAEANEIVTLDGSASYDSDGEIISYTWRRLPDSTVLPEESPRHDCGNAKDPFCRPRATGRAEEVIELIVRDNRQAVGRDRLNIVNKKVKDLMDKVDQLERQVDPTLDLICANTASGVVNIGVTSNNEENLSTCYLYVDNKYVGFATQSPFSFNWDSRYWPNGPHTIKVILNLSWIPRPLLMAHTALKSLVTINPDAKLYLLQ